MIALSDEQHDVLEKIEDFLDAPRVRKPWFSLQGLAGVGKTVVLSELARRRPRAKLGAPTGKAASVLARKSGLVVDTLHSILYNFNGEFVDEETGERYLSFESKIDDGSWRGKVVLADESSMIPATLAQDLLATGARIVACGDPGQLPPVRGMRFFDEADGTLRTVHRQALESPIIRQAYRVRNGLDYEADSDGFQVRRTIEREDILAADMVLCWRNATRHALTSLVRAHRELEGLPKRGEPVMCLRNDRDWGILNGAIYELMEDYDAVEHGMIIRNERGHITHLENVHFETIDPPMRPNIDDEMKPFTFGHVSTVHKAQGSEWNNGILVDEYDRMEHRREFLYTGFTRFAQRVLVRPCL